MSVGSTQAGKKNSLGVHRQYSSSSNVIYAQAPAKSVQNMHTRLSIKMSQLQKNKKSPE